MFNFNAKSQDAKFYSDRLDFERSKAKTIKRLEKKAQAAIASQERRFDTLTDDPCDLDVEEAVNQTTAKIRATHSDLRREISTSIGNPYCNLFLVW